MENVATVKPNGAGIRDLTARSAPAFMRFAGGLSAKDAAEMRATLDAAAFSRVEGEEDGSET